jgi:hypothetical protein
MALTPNAVIWIDDKNGITIEEYKGKYSIKAVQKYQSQGSEKISYDWVKRDQWNPETRKRETPAKANAAMGVSLGEKDQAVASLKALLAGLGVESDSGEAGVPF